MKSPRQWKEDDILTLIADKVSESLNLEYKACDALKKDNDSKKQDLSKDVSAFANSDGGVIVYGVKEDTNAHLAIDLDNGFDQNLPRKERISKEWLEQVISSNIHPRIDNLYINEVQIPSKGTGRVLYVVDIPKGSVLAPHQANDKRYYKRYNFESKAMEDYEVRDIFHRATTPDLHLDFALVGGKEIDLQFQPGNPYSDRLVLQLI
jgi:predicted HTH transcriptional regulator